MRSFKLDNPLLLALKMMFKLILFILLFCFCVVIGLMIGYSLIGDGHFWEVLNRDTWRHIVQFIQ